MHDIRYLKYLSALFCILILNFFISCIGGGDDYGMGATEISLTAVNNTSLDLFVSVLGPHNAFAFEDVVLASQVVPSGVGWDGGIQKDIGTPTVRFYRIDTNSDLDKKAPELLIRRIDNAGYLFEVVKNTLYKSKYPGYYFGSIEYKLTITDELLEL